MGKLNEIGELVKSVTRPFCLAFLVIIIGLMVYQGKDVPTWVYLTFLPFLAWWSYDRTLLHRHERTLQGKDK